MGKDDPKHADIEHLFGDPTVHLNAVGRYAHHRRNRGSQSSAIDDLAAVEHELERLS
jgi:hypothetical protein